MTVDEFYRWLVACGRAWQERDPEAAAALFTDDAIYEETPFSQPLRGRQAIRAYRAEVPLRMFRDRNFQPGRGLPWNEKAVTQHLGLNTFMRYAEELFRLTAASREHLRRWLPWVDATTSVEHSRTLIESSLRQFGEGNGFQAGIWYRGERAGVTDLGYGGPRGVPGKPRWRPLACLRAETAAVTGRL